MRLAAAGLAALALAAVSGCGSSPLSSAELRRDATQICQQANHRVERIATPAGPAQAGAFLSLGLQVLGPEVSGLRRLHPSGAAVAPYRTALDSFGRELVLLRDAHRDLGVGEDPLLVFKGLQARLLPLQQQADNGFRALDIPACLSR